MRWHIVIVVLIVLLAGCSGQSPSQEPKDNKNIDDSDFELSFERNSVTECGPTCRDVNATAEITNLGNETIENASISITLYVQYFYIKEIDRAITTSIWSGSEDIRTLYPNESVSVTREFRIEKGAMIKVAGCTLHYDIAVSHDDGNKTYQDHSKVC